MTALVIIEDMRLNERGIAIIQNYRQNTELMAVSSTLRAKTKKRLRYITELMYSTKILQQILDMNILAKHYSWKSKRTKRK